MASKRNTSIDMFRLAACALVIIQHYRLFNMNTAGALWSGFYCRIAVPFFFMVSGYFSWKADPAARSGYLKKQIVTIGKILAVSSVVLIVYNIIIGYKIPFKPVYIRYLLLYNEPKFLFGHAHMWYMLALIYVFAFGLLVEKLRLNKPAYIAAPLVLAAGIILDFALFNMGGRRACFTRNWIFDGLPFFYMGQFIHRHESKFLSVITKGRGILLLVLSAAAMWLEGTIMLRLGLSVSRTFFISLLPLSFSVFMLLLNFPDIGKGTFIARYARDASMIVYIIHHMVEDGIKLAAESLCGVKMYQHSTIRFILIFTISTAIGIVYAMLAEKRGRRKSRADRLGAESPV
ncbi:MAG: acyltransferase [Oscillospiraceae bacterium]|nr:acyltransferase [Oscillospiraceae bacterium]